MESGHPVVLADLEPILVPIDSVVGFPGNPRRGDVEALRASLRRFGQRRALIVQKSTNNIVAGNHLHQAAKLEGWTEIAVTLHDLDDTEAKALNLADNRLSELGTFDEAALTAMLADLAAQGADALAGVGYSSADLDHFLGGFAPAGDPDEVPVVEPKDVWVKSGQLFALGPHRVLCGDAMDPAAYDRLLGDVEAGMVWTDPPYGVDYVGGTEERLTIENDSLSDIDLTALLTRAFTTMLPHVKKGRAFYVASPSGDNAPIFMAVLRELGLLRQTLIWVKDVFVMGRSDYHYRHEFIHYGWRPGAAHYFVKDRTHDTVLEVERPRSSREHPTMKPVALVEQNILCSSLRDDLILDPFLGSGTTIIAAERTARRGYGIEIEPRYVQVTLERWAAVTGQQWQEL